MSELRSSILATLVLYDAFTLPLTAMGVYERLINPARFSKNGSLGKQDGLTDVMEMLDALAEQGKIASQNGFYFLPGGRVSYEDAIRREKISAQKWKKLAHLVRYLRCVPFLRAIFASGSMALGNPDEQSDFDVVVVARAGRLYTCRLLLSLAASLLGARRTRREHVAPNKLCFNHYLTDSTLAIKNHSLYTAAIYNDLVPVIAGDGFVERFYAENSWLSSYFVRVPVRRAHIRKRVAPSRALRLVQGAGELLLSGRAGDIVERILKRWQQSRIFANPATSAPGGRVIADDTHLEFHPYSAETAILEEYNAATERLGAFWNYREGDSGLTVAGGPDRLT